MAEWFPVRVDEVLTDERVRGLSPAVFRAWVELRALAAAAECGGVILRPSGKGGGRWRLDDVAARLVGHEGVSDGPLGPFSRAVGPLMRAGLLVVRDAAPWGVEFADAERWRDRENRMAADRERSRASREARSNGGRRRGTATANVTPSSDPRLDREVQLRSSCVPLSSSSGARDGAQPSPVRIRTAAHLQRPTGDGDIRPAVREAVTLARNVGTEDARQLLRDTLTDLGDLTMSETLHVATVLGEAGDGN